VDFSVAEAGTSAVFVNEVRSVAARCDVDFASTMGARSDENLLGLVVGVTAEQRVIVRAFSAVFDKPPVTTPFVTDSHGFTPVCRGWASAR
jgi:hypothetical protein